MSTIAAQLEAKTIVKQISFILRKCHDIIRPLHNSIVDLHHISREFNLGDSRYLPTTQNPLIAVKCYLEDLRKLKPLDKPIAGANKSAKGQGFIDTTEHIKSIIVAGEFFIATSLRIFQDATTYLVHHSDDYYLASILSQITKTKEIKDVVENNWLTTSLKVFFNRLQIDPFKELLVVTETLIRTFRTYHDVTSLEMAKTELVNLAMYEFEDAESEDEKKTITTATDHVPSLKNNIDQRPADQPSRVMRSQSTTASRTSTVHSHDSASSSRGTRTRSNMQPSVSSTPTTEIGYKQTQPSTFLSSSTEKKRKREEESEAIDDKTLSCRNVIEGELYPCDTGDICRTKEGDETKNSENKLLDVQDIISYDDSFKAIDGYESSEPDILVPHSAITPNTETKMSKFDIETLLLGSSILETPVLSSSSYKKAHSNVDPKLFSTSSLELAFKYIDDGFHAIQKLVEELYHDKEITIFLQRYGQFATANSSLLLDKISEDQKQMLNLGHAFRKKGNEMLRNSGLLRNSAL